MTDADDGNFISDLSGTAGLRDFGKFGQGGPWGMIVHHTGGNEANGQGVADVLRQRGLGVQYTVDRAGNVSRLIPEGNRGAHMMTGWGPGEGLSNDNMAGVEVVAKNNADVTPAQVAATQRLIAWHAKKYDYDPETSVFGHGEVNPGHKEADEGMATVDAVRGDTPSVATAAAPAGPSNVAVNGAIISVNPATAPENSSITPAPMVATAAPAPQAAPATDQGNPILAMLGKLGTDDKGNSTAPQLDLSTPAPLQLRAPNNQAALLQALAARLGNRGLA